MGLSVRLTVFEGPLDLLLYLIEKNKIDIYDIPIVVITEQYLDYIKNMQTQDMNVMSEFLVMAATLLDIKCRMLLPREVNEEGEEEDDEYEEELKKMAEVYHMDVDKIKELTGEEQAGQIKEDMKIQKAVALITEAAVEKAE